MIVRLGALLGLWPAVWTEDYDGRLRLRKVWKNKPGPFDIKLSPWVVYGVFAPPLVWDQKEWAKQLYPDGTFGEWVYAGPCYLTRWKEWKYNR